MPRTRSMFVAVAILGLAFLAIIYCLLFLPNDNVRKHHQVTAELLEISRAVLENEACNRPPPTAVIELLSNYGVSGSKRFKEGIDPWGTPYFYGVEETDRKGAVMYDVTVRSFGPNRSDDGGEVDDIEQTRLVLVLLGR